MIKPQGSFVMSKPHWEMEHDWRIADLAFEIEQQAAILMLLRHHPEPTDRFRDPLLSILRDLKANEARLKKEYQKIYGTPPRLRAIRDKAFAKAQEEDESKRMESWS